jgi:hypothetical protein
MDSCERFESESVLADGQSLGRDSILTPQNRGVESLTSMPDSSPAAPWALRRPDSPAVNGLDLPGSLSTGKPLTAILNGLGGFPVADFSAFIAVNPASRVSCLSSFRFVHCVFALIFFEIKRSSGKMPFLH